MPAGSPKYMEVTKHLAEADAAADAMGTELAASGPSPSQAKAIVGASAAVSIAMLDLADAVRGYTHTVLHREQHP
jgi:hypothetical protein